MPPYLYVQQQTRFKRVIVEDIILIEGGNKYSSIVTSKDNFLTKVTLALLEPLLGDEHFCRVHQEYIISLAHIRDFDNELINLGDRVVPLGRAYLKKFHNRVVKLK